MLIRPSCVRDLAREHLRGAGVHAAECLDERLRDRAVAAVGWGCDHAVGEQIVAVIDDSIRFDVFLGALITDRVYAWRNMKGSGVVRWEDVESIEVTKGLLVATQRCILRNGQCVVIPPSGVDLGAFFAGLTEIPPTSRSVPPAPLSNPTEPDPTGAHAARAKMQRNDTRHATLYRLIGHLFEGGDHERARQLTSRVTALHRTVCGGRGTSGAGWWASPLCADDLGAALQAVLGPPRDSQRLNDAVVTFDLDVPPAWREKAALEAGALQRDTLGGAGFGRDVPWVRITIAEHRDRVMTAFAIQSWSDGQTLDRSNPALLTRLLAALLEEEHDRLLRRVLGGDAPAHQLATQPVADLAAARRVDMAQLAS